MDHWFPASPNFASCGDSLAPVCHLCSSESGLLKSAGHPLGQAYDGDGLDHGLLAFYLPTGG